MGAEVARYLLMQRKDQSGTCVWGSVEARPESGAFENLALQAPLDYCKKRVANFEGML